ncbi:MAG TPA: hydrolase [Gemmatimonadaceae bacterium]|jgi:nicotinamidase-related amidase|nr:hydrolase [Gemmatimonadaceae bacterium]
MTTPLELTAAKTALVVIDLQAGILARHVAPHAGADVLDRSAKMCAHFRAAGAQLVLVRVSFAADGSDALSQPCDELVARARPDGWDVLSPALGAGERDIHITKHQWGAFYGTELDLQLRRRGITTLVMCGISTNFGVESTARDGWERGYSIVFAEDAMASFDAAAHAFAVKNIFVRIGRVRSTDEILAALS